MNDQQPEKTFWRDMANAMLPHAAVDHAHETGKLAETIAVPPTKEVPRPTPTPPEGWEHHGNVWTYALGASVLVVRGQVKGLQAGPMGPFDLEATGVALRALGTWLANGGRP